MPHYWPEAAICNKIISLCKKIPSNEIKRHLGLNNNVFYYLPL